MEHKISAVLEAKDKFSVVIKNANSTMLKFGKKIISTNRDVKNLGGAIRNTSNSLKDGIGNLNLYAKAFGAFAIGKSFLNFGGNILSGFADLEDQVRRNKAIMGASKKEEELLMAQTKELGKTTKFTAQEVAQAQMYQAMAGMKTNEVLALTPKLLKLSIASGEDLARSSDIVTDNLSAFGLKLKDAERLMDVMAAAANNSNTSISMLGEAYTYVAAASKDFDSMEEVTTILGILADNGIKAGKAGRNLAGIYSRLSKITPDMREQLAKTGTKLYDANGKFKGLRKIIMESKDALSKLTEEQRNNWLATIAGTEGIKIWNSIMNYSVEGTKKVENAIKNSNGAIDQFANDMSSTTKNKMAEFKSAVDGVKIAIGEGLAPVAIDFMNNWIEKINEATDRGLFDTSSIENYFRTAEKLAKGLIGTYAVLKTAVFAATHPVIAGVTGAVLGGGYAGKKVVEHFQLEGKATEIYSRNGGSLSMDEAREEAKKEIEYEKRTANFTSERRMEEIKKGDDILKNALENKRKKEIENHIQNYGASNYKGMSYSNYDVNGIINQKQKAKLNTQNEYLTSSIPAVNINLNGVTVNNAEDIRRISKQVSEDTETEIAKTLFNLYQVQS